MDSATTSVLSNACGWDTLWIGKFSSKCQNVERKTQQAISTWGARQEPALRNIRPSCGAILFFVS